MSQTVVDRRDLIAAISSREATVGIVGLGYVGLPLAVAVANSGFRTSGFDIDEDKTARLNEGRSYIDSVADRDLKALEQGRVFRATCDFSQLADCDVVVMCIPTPLTRHREPDLSFVEATSHTIADSLRRGQLIVLESTSYPGTTREVVKPILESRGLRSGADFLLGFSPEREDPGNREFSTAMIPKVVAGDGPAATEAVQAFYAAVFSKVVPVSSPDVAEAVKITENVFRAVNIALVNELKVVFDRMGIDIWEVIEAAKTKPFGYMPFYPGPGLGGHCIPIDPFYLTWKSREFGMPTRFIELAGEINVAMPRYVVGRLEQALDQRLGRSLSRARVLIVGLAYKKNVADIRESPSFKILELLEERGAATSYHDPLIPVIPPTREHAALTGRQSVVLDEHITEFDAVVIATDHDAIDYELLLSKASLLIDTRNAFEVRGLRADSIIKA